GGATTTYHARVDILALDPPSYVVTHDRPETVNAHQPSPATGCEVTARVLILDPLTLLVINDNKYPGTGGCDRGTRHYGATTCSRPSSFLSFSELLVPLV